MRFSNFLTLLQWGRAPEGAERVKLAASTKEVGELQWGRAPEGAESKSRKTRAQRRRRFNGAAPRRARRAAIQQGKLTQGRASMGPRPGGRGEVEKMTIVLPSFTLQWGRAPEGAERA